MKQRGLPWASFYLGGIEMGLKNQSATEIPSVSSEIYQKRELKYEPVYRRKWGMYMIMR